MELRKITYSACTPNKKEWFGIDATLNENDNYDACCYKLKEMVQAQIKKC